MIYYIRDEEGSLIGFKYNNTIYYYIKNMQEDIIGLTDSSYNLVCSYEYDSWGKLISIKDNNNNIITNSSHIGYINPFRYRSYYYDNETKLYYLNSRYYNPEWGRFVNCDTSDILLYEFEEIHQYNLFSYVLNSWINKIDDNGEWHYAIAGGGILATSGSANIWNPVGWILVATSLVISGIQIYRAAEHTKNKRKSNYDKHTKPRSGRLNTKNRLKPNWIQKGRKRK